MYTSDEEESSETENITPLVTKETAILNEVKVENPKEQSITAKEEKDDITKLLGKAVTFNEIVSQGFADNSTRDLGSTPLPPVWVNDYFNKEAPRSFIPFEYSGAIVSIAVMISDDQESIDSYEPGQLLDVSNESWTAYPPVAFESAFQNLQNAYPLITFESMPGYYHIDGVTPNYQFVNVDQPELHFLVDAINGYIRQIPAPELLQEAVDMQKKEELPPIAMSSSGYVEVDEERAKNLNESERQELLAEIKVANDAIRKGLLKLDNEFNVIYDNR